MQTNKVTRNKHLLYKSSYGHLYSSGVKRDFGENKVLYIESDDGKVVQDLNVVMPLFTTEGLVKIGYIISEV